MDLRKILKRLYPIKELFFPSFCLHCNEPGHRFFCSRCLEYLNMSEDLPFCGSCLGSPCRCRKEDTLVQGFSLFADYGPARTLCHEMKKGKMPILVKMVASYAVIRMNTLSVLTPDLILPVPPLEKNSFCYAKELGKELASLYERKMLSLIYVERKFFSEPTWAIRPKNIEGKVVFFCVNTQKEIPLISGLLMPLKPKAIYGASLFS